MATLSNPRTMASTIGPSISVALVSSPVLMPWLLQLAANLNRSALTIGSPPVKNTQRGFTDAMLSTAARLSAVFNSPFSVGDASAKQ
jgi:hypothetical protein